DVVSRRPAVWNHTTNEQPSRHREQPQPREPVSSVPALQRGQVSSPTSATLVRAARAFVRAPLVARARSLVGAALVVPSVGARPLVGAALVVPSMRARPLVGAALAVPSVRARPLVGAAPCAWAYWLAPRLPARFPRQSRAPLLPERHLPPRPRLPPY